MKRKHLFVALSRSGWGETSLGVEVARQVCNAGDTVSFIAHSGSVPALSGTGYEVREVSEETGPLINLLFEDCLAHDNFASIILSDFLTTNYTLQAFGVDPTFLLRCQMPVITLDTWQYDLTGSVVDVVGVAQWQIGTWIEQVPRRLVPVPIGQPTASGAYRNLPSPLKITADMRHHIRRNLGVKDGEWAVLFCTAIWQQGLKHPNSLRSIAALPQLLWHYLREVDSAVRLIHVGPAALPIDPADERYLWMPAVAPDDFDRLLGSVDLVLSANIAATTIGRAIAVGVPVLVVQNSYAVATVEEAEAKAGPAVSPAVRKWLEQALPLYPFNMWPLGFREFLKPLLRDNPYCSAIDVVELMDEAGFVGTCRRLLFDAGARAAVRERQAAYVARVKQLPTAAQLIDNYLQ